MKKFNSNYNGLLPLYLNDIRFVQQCYDEQIEALIAPYCAFTDHDSFILTGCEIGGETYSAGWVVLNGKIYRCPGGSTPTPDELTEVVWGISTINLAGGAKTPKRVETTVETWQEDIATLVLGILGVPNNVPAVLPTFDQVVDNMINSDTGWVALTLAEGWSASSSQTAPEYRVKNGVTYLRGHIVPAAGAPAVFAILPAVARPSKIFTHANGSHVSGFDYAVYVNGNMETQTPEAYQVLDGVVFMKT